MSGLNLEIVKMFIRVSKVPPRKVVPERKDGIQKNIANPKNV